ncbi:MAG: putative Holliday junction resolvase [Candidatus Krumholzibacteriia bacterium]|jgi:putative Holliday junction resolvase
MPACLGLDYGLRRIGVAASEATVDLAFGVGTHVEGRDGSIFLWLEKLISERGITIIVVGLPLTTAGEVGELASLATAFATKLEQKLGLKTVLWDERYSSQEADRWLQKGRRQNKEERDALAAEIILQSYLDSLN